MFYIFDEIPQPPRLDFKNVQLKDPANFQKISSLLESRNEIVKAITDLSKGESASNVDLPHISSLLSVSIDLLEVAINEDVAVPARFRGFLKNKGKVLNIDLDPEVVFTTDLIYLRYGLAFAYLKEVKQDASNIRKVLHEINIYNDLIKKVIDKVLAASVRIYKLRKAEQFVFFGLYDSIRIYELNHKTLHALDALMRLNLSSILVVKTFANTIGPDKASFLVSLCKRTLLSIDNLKKYFNTAFDPAFQSLIDFLQIAWYFYHTLTLFIIFRLNLFENDGLVKKTKDHKWIIVENHNIGREIKRLMEELKVKQFKSNDAFNVEENKRFCIAFFEKFATGYLDE